jgi:hypothetical protein
MRLMVCPKMSPGEILPLPTWDTWQTVDIAKKLEEIGLSTFLEEYQAQPLIIQPTAPIIEPTAAGALIHREIMFGPEVKTAELEPGKIRFDIPDGGITYKEMNGATALLKFLDGDTHKLADYCFCSHKLKNHVQGKSTKHYGKCDVKDCLCKGCRPILAAKITKLEDVMKNTAVGLSKLLIERAKDGELIPLPVGFNEFPGIENLENIKPVLTYSVAVTVEEIKTAGEIIQAYGFEAARHFCFCGHGLDDHRGRRRRKCVGCGCLNPRAILVEGK